MAWQSGDSLNPTNMNNQTVSNLTVNGTLSAGTFSATAISTQTITDLTVSSTLSSAGTTKANTLWASSLSAAALRLPDGSVAAPSMAFSSDESLGLYYYGAKTLGVAGRVAIRHGVDKDGTAAPLVFSNNTAASTGGSGWQAFVNDGAAMSNGDRLGFYTMGGTTDGTNYATSASIEAYCTEDWSATSAGASLQFKVASTDSVTRRTRATLTYETFSFDGVISLVSATSFPSAVSGTGYLYADSAASLFWVNGSGVSTGLA